MYNDLESRAASKAWLLVFRGTTLPTTRGVLDPPPWLYACIAPPIFVDVNEERTILGDEFPNSGFQIPDSKIRNADADSKFQIQNSGMRMLDCGFWNLDFDMRAPDSRSPASVFWTPDPISPLPTCRLQRTGSVRDAHAVFNSGQAQLYAPNV